MCEFLRSLPLDAISIFLNKLCEIMDSSYLRAMSSLVFPDNGELGPDRPARSNEEISQSFLMLLLLTIYWSRSTSPSSVHVSPCRHG